MRISNRYTIFVNEYLRSFNATAAAKASGYSERTAYSSGQRLLKHPDIAAAIHARLTETAMSADEVLMRLGAIARGNIADLLDIHATGYNIALMVKNDAGEMVVNPQTALIRKIKQKTTTVMSQREDGEDREIVETEIELYSALDALQTLARYHQLFADRVDVGGEVRIVWDYPLPSPATSE